MHLVLTLIALWAAAGILPIQTAYGATGNTQTPATIHQAQGEGGSSCVSDSRTSVVVNRFGDPDQYTTGNGASGTPTPPPDGETMTPPPNSYLVHLVVRLLAALWRTPLL